MEQVRTTAADGFGGSPDTSDRNRLIGAFAAENQASRVTTNGFHRPRQAIVMESVVTYANMLCRRDEDLVAYLGDV